MKLEWTDATGKQRSVQRFNLRNRDGRGNGMWEEVDGGWVPFDQLQAIVAAQRERDADIVAAEGLVEWGRHREVLVKLAATIRQG